MGPLPPSRNGCKCIVVIIDSFSRWVEAIPVTETSATTVTGILFRHFVSKYGAPKRIHSAQGRNLNATVVQKLFDFCGMRHSTSVAYFPQGNGIVERVNKTLQDVVAKGLDCSMKSNLWDELLPSAVFAYNTIPHIETGASHYKMFLDVYLDSHVVSWTVIE